MSRRPQAPGRPAGAPPLADEERRRLLGAAGAMLGGAALSPWAPAEAADSDDVGRKVLRVAFRNAETSLDPARISDVYSRAVTGHIFEALYGYDHLARPFRFVPLAARALPEVSADFRQYTVSLRPGMHFSDDPAFGGRPREVVAQDFVFAIQRILDPANRSPVRGNLMDTTIVGVKQAYDQAVAQGRFDYDRPIEGLQVLDRHTLRFQLVEPRPRLLEFLAASDLYGAQAREVVQRYGADISAHPVGSGPFRLKSWRRSSSIVLERNPGYRERHYDAQPAPDDTEGQALVRRLKGRRLPMVDEVQISVIPEEQPLYLAMLGNALDALATVAGALPGSFVSRVAPGGRLAPPLQRKGMQLRRQLNADHALTYFNMDHPLVGGYTADKVALRRAISLAYDVDREIRLVRFGQGVPAHSQVVPHCSGYDPAFRSEMGEHDPARARALLDMFGYVDRDGDGWREMPDGSPLLLELATEPESVNREFNELWRASMQKVGLRIIFHTAQWSENMKGAYAGRHMMWTLGTTADAPDGQDFLTRLHSPQIGNGNLARFRNTRFDELFSRMSMLPDGPERDALFREAKRIGVAYMPYKVHVHRIGNDLLHPWVLGFRRPLFWNEWWHMVDIDLETKSRFDKP